MHYILNGGRNERAALTSASALALYSQLKIKRVLFIVYAITEDYWQLLWHNQGSLIQIAGMEVRSLTVYDSDKATLQTALAWADFVYLTGGSQETLLQRMEQLGTTEALRSVVASGALPLLGGGSAGAMVMGSWCIVGHVDVKRVVPGLNYLPNYVIDSHFSERGRLPRLTAVIKNLDLKPVKGLGIDEDTAVLFDDQLAIRAVYGPGTVTVCDNGVTIYDKNSPISI